MKLKSLIKMMKKSLSENGRLEEALIVANSILSNKEKKMINKMKV